MYDWNAKQPLVNGATNEWALFLLVSTTIQDAREEAVSRLEARERGVVFKSWIQIPECERCKSWIQMDEVAMCFFWGKDEVEKVSFFLGGILNPIFLLCVRLPFAGMVLSMGFVGNVLSPTHVDHPPQSIITIITTTTTISTNKQQTTSNQQLSNLPFSAGSIIVFTTNRCQEEAIKLGANAVGKSQFHPKNRPRLIRRNDHSPCSITLSTRYRSVGFQNPIGLQGE